MSSLPILLNLIDELDRDNYHGNDFGLGLYPHHIHRHHHHRHEPTAASVGYSLPLSLVSRLGERTLSRRAQQGESRMSPVGKDGLQVCMDVAQFKPSELSVKVVDNSIIIEGKHEEREDEHGYISRHFVRRYTLPKDYDADRVISTLSSDGVLTVSAPKPQDEKSNERVVQIQQTGPAHLNVKHNTEEKIGDANGETEQK